MSYFLTLQYALGKNAQLLLGPQFVVHAHTTGRVARPSVICYLCTHELHKCWMGLESG